MREEKIKKMINVLIPWYKAQGRILPWRKDKEPYHVWISEIMLQQTRIETVIPYYQRFLEEIPDINTLAKANPERLQKLWEGLGYYSRVRNLQAAAQQIMNQHDGRFPNDYDSICKLKGIGDYTAGAIASICFDAAVPAVDGNVLRVISRITGDDRPINLGNTKKEVRAELEKLYPSTDAGICTQAIMELGETVCIPNGRPFCEKCPCRDFCACSKGDWVNYPVKEEKKSRKVEKISIFILRCGDLTAIRKRPDKGLLAGQWEFPNCREHLSEQEIEEKLICWGFNRGTGQIMKIIERGKGKHIFSHIEWDICSFVISCDYQSPEFTWVSEKEIRDNISLPTAFRKIWNSHKINMKGIAK